MCMSWFNCFIQKDYSCGLVATDSHTQGEPGHYGVCMSLCKTRLITYAAQVFALWMAHTFLELQTCDVPPKHIDWLAFQNENAWR